MDALLVHTTTKQGEVQASTFAYMRPAPDKKAPWAQPGQLRPAWTPSSSSTPTPGAGGATTEAADDAGSTATSVNDAGAKQSAATAEAGEGDAAAATTPSSAANGEPAAADAGPLAGASAPAMVRPPNVDTSDHHDPSSSRQGKKKGPSRFNSAADVTASVEAVVPARVDHYAVVRRLIEIPGQTTFHVHKARPSATAK